jgi:hypothetical protein
MSDANLPATPNIPSPVARILSMALEKALTTAAVALAGYGAIQSTQEAQFVTIGTGLVLYGISWLVGVAKAKASHVREVALLNTPPPKA